MTRLSNSQRAAVVELLRCAADQRPDGIGLNGMFDTAGWLGLSGEYQDAAWDALNALPEFDDRPRHVVGVVDERYRAELLEAALRLEQAKAGGKAGGVIDNSQIIAEFCPSTNDGDTFIYTEMLDRSKRKGNNGQRLLKTFYHRSRDEFWEQWPTIRKLCDLASVRACTRVSPRSYRKVGATFTKLVVDAALSDNWAGMKSLYNRACGITTPERKFWLWDFDEPDEEASQTLARLIGQHVVGGLPVLLERVPSKRAFHLITTAFDVRALGGLEAPRDGYVLPTVQLHKDNPTNLYIPDGAP